MEQACSFDSIKQLHILLCCLPIPEISEDEQAVDGGQRLCSNSTVHEMYQASIGELDSEGRGRDSLVESGSLRGWNVFRHVVNDQLLAKDIAGPPQLHKLQQPGLDPGYKAKYRQPYSPVPAEHLLHCVEVGLHGDIFFQRCRSL